jgi:hypothetical protein
MGIKFLCPNGHKLNVKSFLGGKKAICPKCGARVLVPSEATIHDDSPGGESLNLATIPAASAEAASDRAEAVVGPQASASTPRPVVTATSPSGDPLAEAPTAVWYVRPASGGQFGPASSEILRNWLTEGRVGASSLVWRAGWSEWRSAAAVFPHLAAMLASPDVATATTVALPPGIPLAAAAGNGSPPVVPGSLPRGQIVQPGVVERASGPASATSNMPLVLPDDLLSSPARRRRRRNDKSILASAVLAIVIVILLVVLFVLIRRASTSEEHSTTSAATTTWARRIGGDV